MPILAANRQCYAGWHLSPQGMAYDFQGLCQPGELPSQQSSRTCDVPYYRYSGTNVFYDTRGYCDPARTQQPGASTSAFNWTPFLIVGAGVVGWYVWTHRKAIF